MIRNNREQQLCLEKMQVFDGGKCIFVERRIFRGYLVSIEDNSSNSVSMTEDVMCKIHEESN